MTLDFFRAYGAPRMAHCPPQPPQLDPATDEEGVRPEVALDVEVDPEAWEARPVRVPDGWRADSWPERPIRFVDGKDVGDTVTWLRAPGGYPIPVRLSQIGATAIHVSDGACRREFAIVERVVSMVVKPFPWDEVEDLAAGLQAHGFRLLTAQPPGNELTYDLEPMRKAAQNRSNTEMGTLEEAAVAQAPHVSTIIDGRLEPRQGALDAGRAPAVGVIKTHHELYLHPLGLRLLYELRPGERTPVFLIRTADPAPGAAPAPKVNLEVVTWYLRLCGDPGAQPNWGVVRVELPRRWYQERLDGRDFSYVDQLSRLLCEYRCRDAGYARAPVSLHPIVRAEALLGALFAPPALLAQRFYRVAGI